MKKFVIPVLIAALILNLPFPALANIDGECVKMYCACTGQLEDCNFDCEARCKGSSPSPERSYYRDSSQDTFWLAFIGGMVVIGLVLFLAGGMNFDGYENPGHTPAR